MTLSGWRDDRDDVAVWDDDVAVWDDDVAVWDDDVAWAVTVTACTCVRTLGGGQLQALSPSLCQPPARGPGSACQ
eukprot:2576038-Rhodomonas_salina.1